MLYIKLQAGEQRPAVSNKGHEEIYDKIFVVKDAMEYGKKPEK